MKWQGIVGAGLLFVASQVQGMGYDRWKTLWCVGAGIVAGCVACKYIYGVHKELVDVRQRDEVRRGHFFALQNQCDKFFLATNDLSREVKKLKAAVDDLKDMEIKRKLNGIELWDRVRRMDARIYVFGQAIRNDVQESKKLALRVIALEKQGRM